VELETWILPGTPEDATVMSEALRSKLSSQNDHIASTSHYDTAMDD